MPWFLPQTVLTTSRFRATRTFRRSAFTLIEMMVVMAIASVLVGMGVYSYNTISRNVVASSARQVNGQLRLCRSYAVAKREYVALLLPTSANMGANSLSGQYGDQAMRPCIVTVAGNTVTFKEFIKGGDWRFTSKGVGIVPSSTQVCEDVVLPNDTIDMQCIVFKPTGQLNTASTVTIDLYRNDLGAAQQDNKVQMSVNWLTGKVSYLD